MQAGAGACRGAVATAKMSAQMSDQSRLTTALMLSVLLHALLLTLIPLARRARIEIPQPALVDVDLVPPLPKVAPQPAPPAAAPAAPAIPVPKQQIVSMPDEGEEKAPENPRLLSDRDNIVKEEMIHRDEPAAGSPEAKQKPPPQAAEAKAERQPPPPKAPAERPPKPQPAALPKLDQLLPPTDELVREGLVQPQAPAQGAAPAPAPEQQASIERKDLLRHGDPWRNGSLRGGSLDFLPAVREGDVTLLNTKAEQFAPFVRRVAMRVFENFIISLRRTVYSSLQGAVQESVIIEAVMDKRGNLLNITTKDRSVSIALATDHNLEAACRQGFFDRNPPPGAESNDGNIHFLFEAQVAVGIDPGGRRPVGGALLGAGLL